MINVDPSVGVLYKQHPSTTTRSSPGGSVS